MPKRVGRWFSSVDDCMITIGEIEIVIQAYRLRIEAPESVVFEVRRPAPGEGEPCTRRGRRRRMRRRREKN